MSYTPPTGTVNQTLDGGYVTPGGGSLYALLGGLAIGPCGIGDTLLMGVPHVHFGDLIVSFGYEVPVQRAVRTRLRPYGPDDPPAADALFRSLPAGDSLYAFASGKPMVAYGTRYISPTGFVGDAGYPTLANAGIGVQPVGFKATLFGTAKFDTSLYVVLPSGFTRLAFGTAWVSYYTRRIEVVGAGLQVRFGTATLSGGVRAVDLAGHGISSLAMGHPTAWFYLRQLFPTGYVATLYGSTLVDRTHTVEPAGFGGEVFGTLEVYRPRFIVDLAGLGLAPLGFGDTSVSNFIQYAAPPGISGAGQSEVDRFGSALIYNLTQYLLQQFEPTPSDGGVFGDFNLVENRDKVLRPDPINSARYGIPEIANNARIVTTLPFQDFSVFGDQLVAAAIRYLSPQGTDTSVFGSPLNLIVYNAARQLYPAGWQDGAFGVTDFFANRQFSIAVGFDMSLFGDTMVDFAIRTLKPFAIPGDFPFGLASVTNYQRFIAPAGIDVSGRGVPTLEEHFTIIRPSSVLPPTNQVGGGGRVYNLTPELHQQGAVASLYGVPQVHNQFETYAMQGFDAQLFGRASVEFRTKTIGVYGWNQLYIPTVHRVSKVTPDLPGARTLDISGADAARYGEPNIHTNVLRPEGFTTPAYGTPKVVSSGVLPQGVPPPYDDTTASQFGTASLNRNPLVFPEGFETIGWGVPDFGPKYVWAPYGYPYSHGAGEQGELMDNRFIGNNTPTRPFFGRAVVTHLHRKISMDGTSFGGVGEPSLALRIQYARPDGVKFQKFGIPVLNGGGGFQCYGFDQARYGTAKIAFPPYTGPQTVHPAGLASLTFSPNDIQNFNRNIYPQGWVEFRTSPPVPPQWPRIATWVSHEYDPFPVVGFTASGYGLPWVSFRVRELLIEGMDTALVNEYSAGSFADRMRVTKRVALGGGASGISVGSTGAFGTPTISAWLRALQAQGFSAGVFGRPVTRRANRVNVSGWESLVFGDVQRWESGKVKPHGDELALFGGARIDRIIHPVGVVGAMGTASVASAITPAGVHEFGSGTPTLIAGVCGVRALAAQSVAAGAVGMPGVSA